MLKYLATLLVLVPSLCYSAGPYDAHVIRVLGSGTVEVSVGVWPGILVVEKIHLEGVYVPDIKSKSACEKALGQKAKGFTMRFLNSTETVSVFISKRDSFGRMIGNIVVDRIHLSIALLENGLARIHTKDGKEKWCVDN